MKKIIITGVPRTGSSALNNVLNLSPNILTMHEMRIFDASIDNYHRFKKFAGFGSINTNHLSRKKMSLYDLDNFFIGNFLNKGSIEFFGDKMATYCWDETYTNHLVTKHSDAYFIFTHRNPCAVIYSGYKRSQIDGNKQADWYYKSLEESISRYIKQTTNWSTLIYPNVKNKIIINYDDYVNNIDLLIKDLNTFLGIDMATPTGFVPAEPYREGYKLLIDHLKYFQDRDYRYRIDSQNRVRSRSRGFYEHLDPNEYKKIFSKSEISYINKQTRSLSTRIRYLIRKEAKVRSKIIPL